MKRCFIVFIKTNKEAVKMSCGKANSKVAIVTGISGEMAGVVLVGNPDELTGTGFKLEALYKNVNEAVLSLNHMSDYDPQRQPIIDYALKHGLYDGYGRKEAIHTLFPEIRTSGPNRWAEQFISDALASENPEAFTEVLQAWRNESLRGGGDALTSAVSAIKSSLDEDSSPANAKRLAKALELILQRPPDLNYYPDYDTPPSINDVTTAVLDHTVRAQLDSLIALRKGKPEPDWAVIEAEVGHRALQNGSDSDDDRYKRGGFVYLGLLKEAKRNLENAGIGADTRPLHVARKALEWANAHRYDVADVNN
jgi:hypothetical protein